MTTPHWIARLRISEPRRRDTAAALAFAVVYLIGGRLALDHGWYPNSDALHKFWGAGAAAVVALLGRERWPAGTLITVIILYPEVYGQPEPRTEFYFVPIVLAAWTVAVKGRLPVLVILALAEAAIVRMLFTFFDLEHDYIWQNDFWWWHPSDVALVQICLVAAVLLGRAARRQQQATEELRSRNEELQRLRQVENEQLVTAERTRIARELHDVVAHHLSAVVIRAQAAERVSDTNPEEPLAAVRWIAGNGQEMLTAMRQVVRVLRSRGSGSLLAPQATLGELPAIVERMAAVGLPVELRRPPEPMPALPTAVELATVRIVQEALTNVLVHARATRALVEIAVGPGEQLRLTVHDDGPRAGATGAAGPAGASGAAGATAGAASRQPVGVGSGRLGLPARSAVAARLAQVRPGAALLSAGRTARLPLPHTAGPAPRNAAGSAAGRSTIPPNGGNGLIGMRERAASCGGTLRIGRSPLGGWSVSAVLPFPQETPADSP